VDTVRRKANPKSTFAKALFWKNGTSVKVPTNANFKRLRPISFSARKVSEAQILYARQAGRHKHMLRITVVFFILEINATGFFDTTGVILLIMLSACLNETALATASCSMQGSFSRCTRRSTAGPVGCSGNLS
jgi:hypothetical protein